MRHDRLFDHPTGVWTARGVAIGFVLVMAAFVVAVAISGHGMDLLGATVVAAVFGGAGMGAMFGATFAQFHQPEPALEPTTGPRRANHTS